MKYKISFFYLIIFIFLGSCATIARESKTQLLVDNLQKWKAFRADGIITFSQNTLELRKNIKLLKTPEQIKLVIFDSGLFGLKPEPFLVVTVDSIISIKGQESQNLQLFEKDSFPGINFLLHPELLLEFSDKIISKNHILIENKIYIEFTDEMKLQEIEQLDTSYKVYLSYQNNLDSIQLYQDKTQIANIQIDKIDYPAVEKPSSK